MQQATEPLRLTETGLAADMRQITCVQQVVAFSLAIGIAGWAGALAVPTNPPTGESWVVQEAAPLHPVVSSELTLARPSSQEKDAEDAPTNGWTPTRNRDWRRFGSGLEDDAPPLRPNVFHESGLEQQTLLRANPKTPVIVRFGSGLEDDAPTPRPNVFLQSGLERFTFARANPSKLRFESGLEKGAPRVPTNVFRQAGF
jgi:hypothetical protein